MMLIRGALFFCHKIYTQPYYDIIYLSNYPLRASFFFFFDISSLLMNQKAYCNYLSIQLCGRVYYPLRPFNLSANLVDMADDGADAISGRDGTWIYLPLVEEMAESELYNI